MSFFFLEFLFLCTFAVSTNTVYNPKNERKSSCENHCCLNNASNTYSSTKHCVSLALAIIGSNLNYFNSLFRCKYKAFYTFLKILFAAKYPTSQQEYIKLISGSEVRMFPCNPAPLHWSGYKLKVREVQIHDLPIHEIFLFS